MDPLSDVLSLLKLRTYLCGGLDMGGRWSLAVPRHDCVKCYVVVCGEGFLAVEGVPDAVRLKAGDCFILPRGWPFRLASDLSLPPTDAQTFMQSPRQGGIICYQGGGDFLAVGGHFALEGATADLLLQLLPPIVHLRGESDKAMLRWGVERMTQELRDPQPGGFLVAQQLASMILIQALRLHMEEQTGNGVGWLFALADKEMSAALGAMHEEPARRWTVGELAERACMSRSTFALKFKTTVGTPPLEYLTRWRMLLAGDRLASSGDSVSAIALSLGYESESAFSTAFKRVQGCSPRQYGRVQNPALASQNYGAGIVGA